MTPHSPPKQPRHGRGGLALKLVLLQLLWMLPALGLADYFVLLLETQRLEQGLAEGRLEAEASRIATEIESHQPDPALLNIALDRQRLLLERARGGLAEGAGHILVELSEQPLSLSLIDLDGQTLAHSGPPLLSLTSSDLLHFRSSLPLQLADGQTVQLIAQVAVPRPGLSLLQPRSFEGSLLVLTALLLATSGGVLLSFYLSRRLGRIRGRVMAWRRGEFADRIAATQGDELGVLATDLDAMAADLDRLLHDRARLAALEERQRVARDLHDTVKQKAFALGLQLATLRRGQAGVPALTEAERLCGEIRDELAAVVTTLHPLPRPPAPFRERLVDRARRWQLATGLQLHSSCEPGPEPGVEVAEQLLRVLDEALANVARHAGPCCVRVGLQAIDGGRWQLQISDDGRGFDPAQASGRGLQHLRERAEAIGARMSLQSGPGGTRLALQFELPRAQASAASSTALRPDWQALS